MSHEAEYIYLPVLTVGGPAGDYEVHCPIKSCQWAEFAVDMVTNGDVGTGTAVVSGDAQPLSGTIKYDGTVTINGSANNNAAVHGLLFRIPLTTTQVINSSYERITNSEKKVFLRLDPASSCSMYVAIRFRIMPLKVIPGPSHEVHPDHMDEMNRARSDKTKERLGAMGIPAYAQEK